VPTMRRESNSRPAMMSLSLFSGIYILPKLYLR
jgi:hypothetical protein